MQSESALFKRPVRTIALGVILAQVVTGLLFAGMWALMGPLRDNAEVDARLDRMRHSTEAVIENSR